MGRKYHSRSSVQGASVTRPVDLASFISPASSWILSGSVALPLLLGLPNGATGSAADTDRARRLDEQREDAAVRKAQQEVADAQQEIRDAQQSLLKAQTAFRKAEAARKVAGIALQQTIDRLEKEHAESAGLIAARTQLKEAREGFREAAAPILTSVKQGAAYQAAEKDLAAATAALEPEANSDREEAAGKAAAARATMRDLERAATDLDPRLKPLTAKIDAAEMKLEAAQVRFEKAVEKDADLKAVRKTFDAARAEETKTQQSLVKENRGLVTARSKLSRAQQALHAKKIADQKDSNKPVPKKKANPKGK